MYDVGVSGIEELRKKWMLMWSFDDLDVPWSLSEHATCPSRDEPQGLRDDIRPRKSGDNNVFNSSPFGHSTMMDRLGSPHGITQSSWCHAW